jgi:putative ATP-binding cassette transporter
MSTEPDVPTLQFALRRRSYPVRLWALMKPYWVSEDRWAGRGLLLLVVALNVATVVVTVLIADWNRQFFNALEAHDYPAFLRLIVRFAVLAAIYTVSAVDALYLNQMLQIRWRRWLTEVYYRDWLAERSYYVLQLEDSEAENPEQRIQDDIGITTTMTLTRGTGLLNAVLTLGSFLVMLWTLSGTLTAHVAGLTLSIPGLFLPQKPYLPIATLREVLSYPGPPGAHPDGALRQALVDAQLPHLVDRLDEEANWSLGLSGGEQQRIGFARVFLHRPDWLFMDEATSALDESTEQALYALVRERLPDVTLVSVAHRVGVARFHRRRLTIRPETGSIDEHPVGAAAG